MSRPRPKRSGTFLADRLTGRRSHLSTEADFEALFQDDTRCRLYLTALRWPEGFCCPHCGNEARAERSRRALLRCTDCGFVCAPTTGTLLERSPLPLTRWMRAIWALVSHESGADLTRLKQVLSATRDQTVYAWLDSLRDVFDKAWLSPLAGLVEVAKIPIEVIAHDERGRSCARHAMVAIAVEAPRGDEPGEIRIRSLPRVSPGAMVAFVGDAVAEHSCVRTGPWRGYGRLRHHGYAHMVTRSGADDGRTLIVAQQVASLLRLWLWSTRGVELARLDYYLAEFSFRYNARLHCAVSDRAALFDALLSLALDQDGVALPAARSSTA